MTRVRDYDGRWPGQELRVPESLSVLRIASLVPVTQELLDDAEPFRDYVDEQLYGIKKVAAAKVVVPEELLAAPFLPSEIVSWLELSLARKMDDEGLIPVSDRRLDHELVHRRIRPGRVGVILELLHLRKPQFADMVRFTLTTKAVSAEAAPSRNRGS